MGTLTQLFKRPVRIRSESSLAINVSFNGDPNIKDAKEDYVEASIMTEVNGIAFDEQLRIQVQPEVEEPQEEGDGEAD